MPTKPARGKNARQRKVRLALLLIGILVVLLLVGQGVNLVSALYRPLNQYTARSYLWDGKSNFNIAFLSKGVWVVSLNPIQKKVTVITLPAQTYLEVPRGFGRWQLRAVFDLGEPQGEGGRLLEDTLTSFLGVPVEGFIKFKGSLKDKEVDELIGLIRQTPVSLLTNLQNIDSDLNLWELLRWNFTLFRVRFDKVKSLDLKNLGVLDRGTLADGTEIFNFDPVKADSIISDLVEDKFKQENLSVAVFNGSERPLMAQRAARLITNLGGSVIQISNFPQPQNKTVVFGENSKTLDRLRQIFASCGQSKDCDKIDIDLDKISSRAQINVILGEDFFFRFGN